MSKVTVSRELLESHISDLRHFAKCKRFGENHGFTTDDWDRAADRLQQALASEPAEQPGDVDQQRDFEETLKYSERDRGDIEDRAIERFKFRDGGFELGTHPENHPEGIPDEWHEKPFARIHYDGESPDWDAGFQGWEGFCLSPDQSGTVLADLIAAALRPQGEQQAVALCHPADDGAKKWLLMFEDPDCGYSLFDNEQAALEAWHQARDNWNCHLFVSQPQAPANDAQGEAVATLLLPDPDDERDGFHLSLTDSKRLASLPAGTKLFLAPPPSDEAVQSAASHLDDALAHIDSGELGNARDAVELARADLRDPSDAFLARNGKGE